MTSLSMFVLSGLALMVCLPSAGSASGETAAIESDSHANCTWLQLHWGGTVPTISEDLTIDSEGRVRVRLQSGERDDRLGLFGFTLPRKRLTQLREAIRQANLPALDDEYPPRPDATEVEWVTLAIDDPQLGRKQVKASNRSLSYPRALRRLFDLRPYPPGGPLGQLITEAVQTPIAAIRFSVTVPQTHLWKGDAVNAAVVLTNTGKEPVVLASLECRLIVRGTVSAYLQNDSTAHIDDQAGIDFGWRGESSPGLFDNEAKADLAHVVRLMPGEEWRIAIPKPLTPPEPGLYNLRASLWMFRQYDLSVLIKELGNGFICGWVYSDPVDIVVADKRG